MTDLLRLLQIEDSESDANLVVRILEKGGYGVRAEVVDDADAMRAALAARPWDVIIADYCLPRLDARGALEILRQSGLDIPFLVVSGTIGEELAVAMMKAGAHDYLMKDNLTRLAPAVRREIHDAKIRREHLEAEQSLRLALAAAEERQRLLDAVFSAQTDVVLVFDVNRVLVHANPAARSFAGTDPTGMRIEEIVEKFQLRGSVESFATHRALLGETVFGVEHPFGDMVGEFSSAPMRDASGTITGAVTMMRDITARKRAERQAEEANRRYDSLAEQSRTIIWEIDAKGSYSFVGPMSEPVWGYQPEELVGKKHFHDLHTDEGPDRFSPAPPEISAQKGSFLNLEQAVRTKDGRTAWVSTNAIPVLDNRGAVVGYRGSDTDITERKRAQEEVRLSEQRYRSLFEHMLNGFTYCQMLYDDQNRPVDFITLAVNQAFEQLTGLRNVIGKRVTEVIPGVRESVPELFEIQGRVALTGKPERFEFFFKAIGRWLSVSAYSPAKSYFVALFDDVTERKQNETDSEAMMTLLRSLSAPSERRELMRTVAGMLREWSECETAGISLRDGSDFICCETRGAPPEFVETRKHVCIRDLAADSGGNPVLECLCDNVLSGRIDAGRPYYTARGSFWTNGLSELLHAESQAGGTSNMTNCLHRDGNESAAVIPLRCSGRTCGLLQLSDRRTGRFTPKRIERMERTAASIAIALEQRATQDALRASEERYRLISENAADVIWMLDVDSDRYSYVSPSAQQMLGYSPDELLALGLRATLTEESHEIAAGRIAEVAAAAKSGKSAPARVERVNQVRKDGTVIQTEVVTTFLPEPGRVGRILGVTRDITERAKAEARLLQAQKLESVGRLAGGVAHDFNNLLTVINGYAGMALRKLPPDDPMREDIGEIAIAGERAAQLTRQLLVLSRKHVVQPKPLNVNEVIVEVEKMLGRLIGEDIRLESVLSPDLGPVMADPGQLHQVLMNLAVNARDAMPRGGKLLIETANMNFQAGVPGHPTATKAGPYVLLTVSDTGLGMTPEAMSHLFEPFFTTKQLGQGTGLGLATVYGIVTQLGGSIQVYSEVGHGTAFKIYLPRIVPAEAAAEPPGPETSALRGAETVLLVEDQEQLRKWAARVLRDYGYDVHDAANPEEAMMRAESLARPIHLLLTDVVMPGISGPELAARLGPLRPEMKIVFISGYSERNVMGVEAIEASGYLPKPFSAEALLLKIREALERPHPKRTILVADDDPGVRNLLRKILTDAGYQVIEAKNGKEAVRQIETSDIDLLITDLVMPEQEGIETIQQLHKTHPRLRIIATSGQFAGPLLRATEFLGAHMSLAKPIQQDELLKAVAHQIAESRRG